jgi:hypothetical protein
MGSLSYSAMAAMHIQSINAVTVIFTHFHHSIKRIGPGAGTELFAPSVGGTVGTG